MQKLKLAHKKIETKKTDEKNEKLKEGITRSSDLDVLQSIAATKYRVNPCRRVVISLVERP